jgi:chloramphenicol-sensitive protein RarD
MSADWSTVRSSGSAVEGTAHPGAGQRLIAVSAGDNHSRLGVAAALAAFITWGVVPVYFKWLIVVPPLEIISHRILWSMPVLAGFLLLRDGMTFFTRIRIPIRNLIGLSLSGLLLAVNWLLFVWAVSNEQILATSLGYFIGPLVNVVLGFLFLRERLRPLETGAVLVAALGTAYLTWYLGVAPWISLGIAFSFGAYGLIRKKLDVGPMIGLFWEGMILSVPAIAYLVWLDSHGGLAFGHVSSNLDWLLAFAGLVTILPLIWFNVAARKMSLSTLGFFQYIAPSLTFLLAVFIYNEVFNQGHAVAFGCIWAALLVISIDRLRRARRQRLLLK